MTTKYITWDPENMFQLGPNHFVASNDLRAMNGDEVNIDMSL